MSALRIAHVVPTYLPATRYGGPIYSVHGLCRGLAALGHEVHVFTTSVDGPHDSPVPHGVPVDLEGVRVHYFESKHLRRLYWSPRMRAALKEQLADFDVVHLHSVFLWPTNMAARLCVRSGVPYVLSPRGMLVPELIRQKNALVKRAWLRLIESFTVQHAGRMHYTSAREQEEAAHVYPTLPRGCVVPNGIDTPKQVSDSAVSERVRAAIEGGPYCLFLGRVHWVKGIDTLLRAIADTDIRVVICGNDEEGYGPKVDALVETLKLQRRVLRLEPVFGDDKWKLIGHARMLVLPSLSENFGNVVPEAMVMACPVVTNPQVGAAAVVEQAQGGIVAAATAGALREALLALWNDDALRERMSQNARNYVNENLLWSRVAQQMTDCYAQMLVH